MNIRTPFVLLCLTFFSHLSPAQKGRLTDNEVQAAIARGASENPSKVGLTLIQPGNGFEIAVYTPSAQVEWEAAEAHRLLKPFTLADVTEAMRSSCTEFSNRTV